MPLYRCTVLDALGKKKTILRTAGDEWTLRSDLKQESYHLLSARVTRDKSCGLFSEIGKNRKYRDVVGFLRQFAVMVKAGIPIGKALNNLRRQGFSSGFRTVLRQVSTDLESGSLLSEAFERHPKVFPHFLVRMISVGEASGSLDTVLSSLADYYESERRVKMKVTSSMIYPSLLLVMVVAVMLFVTLFVLPQFEDIIRELGGEVPRITVVMMDISAFVQAHILWILLSLVAIGLMIWCFLQTPKGKYVRDWLLCHIPIVGRVHRDLLTARFSKALVMMQRSGMNMVDSLEQLKRMLGNQVYAKRFAFTIAEVKRGRSIAAALKAAGLFSPILIEMIGAGEKSGNLEEVLDTTGAYFDARVESDTAKAIAIVEPLTVLLLGVVVALVIFSVLLPMMSLMNSI